MNKRLVILVVFLWALAYSASGQISQRGPFDPGAARQDNTYTKAESDALAAQSSLRYHFTEDASDVAGYEGMATSPVAVQASEAKTLATSIGLIDGWITPAGTPNLTTLVSGAYEASNYISKTGAGDAKIIMELWSRDLGGTETFIASSPVTTLVGTLVQNLTVFRITLPMNVTILATDRLVLKMYAYRVGVAGLTLWYGGVTNAYFGVPIEPRNFMRTSGSNSDAITTLKALTLSDVGKFSDGTAAAPSVTFGSDPDTGIYRYGANDLGLTTNGSVKAIVKSGGNVLIGTTTDDGANKLQVNGHTKIGVAHRWQTFEGYSSSVSVGGYFVVGDYTVGANDQFDVYVTDVTDSMPFKGWGSGSYGVYEVHDPSTNFSITKDNAGTINVYVEGGQICIQNNLSAAKYIKAFVHGFND